MAGLTREGKMVLDDVRDQLRPIEDKLSSKVREKPLQTLCISAGIGFLTAVLLGR